MGWEDRDGRRYYYRKRREGERVVSEYVGHGELAQLLAQQDAEKRAADHVANEVARAEQDAESEIERRLDQTTVLVDALTEGALRAAGLHYHRGEWRRRRND